jgi:hypothetical protein
MTDYVLSVDPGWSTGIALIGYSDTAVWREQAWQFEGGVVALGQWIQERDNLSSFLHASQVTVIAEKFTPRPNEKFGLTLRSVEPLRCEGILVDRGLLPDYENTVKVWRQPKDQYVVGGKDKIDKKKRLHAFLKDTGEFYVTGKPLDAPNADDARSAIGHALGYLSRVKHHEPTFKLMSDWSEKHGS